MSDKPLDCVGVELVEGAVGKHSFVPSGKVVHGPARPLVAEELAAVTMERDALVRAIESATIISWGKSQQAGDWTDGLLFALDKVKEGLGKTLAKLACGDLRKP